MNNTEISKLVTSNKFLECLEFMLQDDKIFKSISENKGIILEDIKGDIKQYLSSRQFVKENPEKDNRVIEVTYNTMIVAAVVENDTIVDVVAYEIDSQRNCLAIASAVELGLMPSDVSNSPPPVSEETDDPEDYDSEEYDEDEDEHDYNEDEDEDGYVVEPL